MAVILGSKGGSSGGGGAPSGPAGGDLTGTYPNPTVAAAYTAARVSNSIVDAKGDLIVATAADTVARKAVGATNGMVLSAQSAQADGLLWALPPGYEFAYAQNTSAVTVSATTEGTANTVATTGAVTYDGSTVVLVQAFSYEVDVGADAGGNTVYLVLRESTTVIAYLGGVLAPAALAIGAPVTGLYRFTPSAASHTYNLAAYRTNANGSVAAAANAPSFLRITKAA